MNLPDVKMSDLVQVGAHFGHKTYRWNPKMSPYIFDTRSGIHILDMTQTVPRLKEAMAAIQDIVARNGRVLFVGTKRQASKPIAEAAQRSLQHYVNHRWLGGMLTNWKTVANSIKRLEEVEKKLEDENTGFTKKELLNQKNEYDKLQKTLGGVRSMGGTPDMLFIIDTNHEAIAVKEAKRLGIPIVAIVDSDSDPEDITYPIPGNDDSSAAVRFYCEMMATAALQGIEASAENEEAETPPEESKEESKEETETAEAPAEPEATEATGEAEKE